jgi:hypothetical protein
MSNTLLDIFMLVGTYVAALLLFVGLVTLADRFKSDRD